ncbi:MAG: hypothetical protein ABI680_01405 [Chthoniobacteraceae bacterium]
MKIADMDALLCAGAPVTEKRPLRLFRRAGEPLLLLPLDPFLARQGLSLYPAQSTKARLARALAELCLRFARWPVGGSVNVEVSASAPLPAFLAKLHGGTLPPLAALLGNPRAPGRRIVFLTFDNAGCPRFVAKAGASVEAIVRLAAEAEILGQLPATVSGFPKLHGQLHEESVAALAFEFVPGRTPRRKDDAQMPSLLEAWISMDGPVACGTLPAWQRLMQAPKLDPAAHQTLAVLASRKVCSAIHHGDFAPWNVKIDGDRWIALDWERGELAGPPTWDWLHYVIQRAVLVDRSTPTKIARELEALFASPAFALYTERAQCAGLEWTLAAAYLWHACEVVGQSEGLDSVRALAQIITLTRL